MRDEPVVVLTPTDIASARALAEITADTLRQVGMKVQAPAMDWATLVQRRANDRAGCARRLEHLPYQLVGPGHGQSRPATFFCAATARDAAPGWPDSPRIEGLRDDWFAAPDLPAQQALARHAAASGVHRCALHPARPVFRADRLPGESDRDPEGQSGVLEFAANMSASEGTKDGMSDFELVWDFALRRRGIAGLGRGQPAAAVL